MKLTKTNIPDLLIIEPQVFNDERGYFFESYNLAKFTANEIPLTFVQDNQSRSSRGVVRGLHYQIAPYAQTKLIRVLEGAIFDVAVDIRNGSPTYGQWYGLELTAENKKQLLVPVGFAHGFSVLSDKTTVFYKCDETYHPNSERGIIFNDANLNIDWHLPKNEILVSAKDKTLPTFTENNSDFIYKK